LSLPAGAGSPACELILGGYTRAIVGTEATPFVLAENHSDLARQAQQAFLDTSSAPRNAAIGKRTKPDAKGSI